MRLLTQNQATELDQLSTSDYNISNDSLIDMAGKKTAVWGKKLKPEIRKHMKDAFKSRMGKGSDSVHHDEH